MEAGSRKQSIHRALHHRAAVLFLVVVTLLLVVETIDPRTSHAAYVWMAYAIFAFWGIHVARSRDPQVVPMYIAALGYLFVFSIVEEVTGVALTPFDPTATYGAVLILSTLTGALVESHRTRWAVGLSVGVGAWILAYGIFAQQTFGAMFIRWVLGVAGVLVTVNTVSSLLEHLTDLVTSHERARRLNDAIAACSESLLVHSDRFALHEAARALIQATDADYFYISRSTVVDGEPGWEIVAEASRRGVGHTGGLSRGRNSDFPTTTGPLSEGRPVVIRPELLPPEEAQRYEEDGMVSEVLVPILAGREVRGTVGFIQYTEDRAWQEEEIEALQRAADMIGAYWQRLDQAEELKASNESKDRLISSVSHEIRTPLTAIVGLSEAIVSGWDDLNDDEICELMQIIARQSRELSELVEDLLVASRADFGNLSIRPEPVDLVGQARRVVEGVHQAHSTRKRIMVDGEEVWAWADPLRVRQIIRNLVTNAIKYGGSNITVRFETETCKVRLVVTDDGPGVSPAEAERIFERYYRSSQSPTLPGSVGIGLAVSRQLAELMDGTLRYVPGEKGGFVLSLPSLSAGERADTLPA